MRMANVLLFHYREAQTGRAIFKQLKAAGHNVVDAVPEYPDFEPSIEVARPEVVVADCTKLFNKAIEAADFVTSRKAYREVPVLLVNLDDANQGFAKMKLPGAKRVAQDEVVAAVAEALP